MSTERAVRILLALTAAALSFGGIGSIAQETPSCSEKMTQQLRRFSETCIADIVGYVSSQPALSARISGEKEKFYVAVVRHGDALVAEAVSKFNYPLMKPDTPDLLKQMGWQAPENESDNWKKSLGSDAATAGGAAQEVSRALAAYGLKPGEAMSVTIGAEQPK